MKTHLKISTMPMQQAAYGLTPNIMQLAGLQGGTGNPLLDMYSQYAAATYSPQVGLHSFSFLLHLNTFGLLFLPQQMVPAVTQAPALTTSLEQQQQQQPQQLPQSLVAGKQQPRLTHQRSQGQPLEEMWKQVFIQKS